MKNIVKNIIRYVKNEEGLVTIEWVGIAAVVVLAAIVISAGIMQGATGVGTAIKGQQTTVANDVSAPQTPPNLNFTP